MMGRNYCWIAAIVGCFGAGAYAEIVVDHSANRNNAWYVSDTATAAGGGWELTADDISLTNSATIRHVAWYGFYYSKVTPAQETTRIRIYSARESDGLPGDVLWEESIANPLRVSTGRLITGVPAGGRGTVGEYRYDADLTTPLVLQGSMPYWLEVAQVGDEKSMFCWAGASIDNNRMAHMSTDFPDWSRGGLADMAFQLSTIPEPMTAVLLVVAAGLVAKGRRRKWIGFSNR